MRSPSRVLVLPVALAALAGCGSDEGFGTGVPVPTEVAVDPANFLGSVRCSVQQGAMRSYVVTLTAWDDLDDLTPFPLGSTIPTPCSVLAGFRSGVVVGSRYTAEIDGYDVPPESLTPFGGPSTGSRTMLDAETGEPVEPRWTSRCGDGPTTGAVAEQNSRVVVQPCTAALDMSSSPTALEIAPNRLLGGDACSQADTLDVVEESGLLAPIAGLACDAEPVLVDAVATSHYSLYVTAHAAAAPDRGALCQVLATAGETALPICNPLSANGAARVRLHDLQANDQPVCPASAYFDLLLDDLALNGVPLACNAQAVIQPLEPGLVLLDAVVYDGQGAPLGGGALCGGDVLPGKTVDAYCLPK